ncbi:hypothetical protein A6A04_00295 [Paramagnetospirillum marisnigri]|uniref:Uncharacterized protein n=1 Tax=Paramagnetospirillum marisnigri TaxID=1285242 RepID=A0A178MSE9_9PROT|nr:hypothetical protein [Paramagnetospirillum marisnigri]OAN52182.1 hypothetical protein A6A04_00295 [Paramagnetospirillum marisnigri]
MERGEPEELWRRLQAEGAHALDAAERLRLASWAESPAPTHEAEATRLQELAAALIAEGETEAALAAQRLAVDGFERLAVPGSIARLDALRSLATVLLRADRLDEAEAAVDRLALLAAELKRGRDGQEALVLYHRAAIADRRGDGATAPVLLRQALALAEGEYGPVGGWPEIIRRALAGSLDFLGMDTELLALLRRGAALASGTPEAERVWLVQLAKHLGRQGPSAELEQVQQRLVDLGEVALPEEQAEDLIGLGRLLTESGRAAEAVEQLSRALSLIDPADMEPGVLASARFWLAEAMSRTEDGDPEVIHDLYRAAIDGFVAIAGPGDDAVLHARHALGNFLWSMGLLEEAAAELGGALTEAEAAQSLLAAELGDTLTRLRRRRLSVREKGRIFAWALALARDAHGEDKLSVALAALRAAAEHAESEADRRLLWAEAAILLVAVGHEDQALAIAEGALAEAGASQERARVHAEIAAERLRTGDDAFVAAAIARACDQAEAVGGSAMDDLVTALARSCGAESPALRALPDSALPRLRQAMIAEKVARGDLAGAMVLFEAWKGPLLAGDIRRDLARLAADEGHAEAAVRLARGLGDGPFALDGVEILLRMGAEPDALAAIGALESGLAFIEGVARAARHFGLKGDRGAFVRRAGEAFTHLADRPLEPEQVAGPLARIAEGALELMGKDQALVWAAGQLPDSMLSAFAGAMGRALEEKRGIGGDATAVAVGVALEQCRALTALGRWDDAIAALSPLDRPASLVGACVQVAEAACAAGHAEAAARALKAAFARLGGADARCGRGLGEAVAGLLPAEWRGAFADAALNRAAAMDDLRAATTHVVAAAHAAVGAV